MRSAPLFYVASPAPQQCQRGKIRGVHGMSCFIQVEQRGDMLIPRLLDFYSVSACKVAR